MPPLLEPRRNVILRVPKIVADPDVYNAGDKSHGEAKQNDRHTVDDSSDLRRPPSPRETSIGQADTTAKASQNSTYPYTAQAASAAEWNSLLIWARKQRGPQWDSSTGMWHVDQGSTEYYAFGNDPARHTKLSVAKRPDLHHGNDSEHEPVDSMDTNPSGASVGDDSTMTIYAGNEDSPPIGPGGRRSRAR